MQIAEKEIAIDNFFEFSMYKSTVRNYLIILQSSDYYSRFHLVKNSLDITEIIAWILWT